MTQESTRIADPRTADVYTVLDDLSDIVESARAMPMSDKCVVNRNEVLDLLDAIRAMLPTAVKEAEEILADRAAVVEDAYQEAERVVAEANAQADALVGQGQAHQAALVSTHEVTRAALTEAETIRGQAQAEADQMRREVDDYLEERFTTFESSLTKTLSTVQRSRERVIARRSGQEQHSG
jgi:cell division septum initiation protein DivIVA